MSTRRTLVRTIALGFVGIAGCLDDGSNGDEGEGGSESGNESEEGNESENAGDSADGGETDGSLVQFDLPDVDPEGSVPTKYTCDGDDVSPAVEIGDGDAEALALVLDDPDAPSGTFTHWTVWNLRPGTDLPEGVPREPEPAELDGARQGENDFDEVGYRGPCPPEGDDPHEYRFTLYALSSAIDADPGATAETVREAIDAEAIASSELTATYGR